MATSDVVLPPMAKISMIGIWIETVLYGINCVMFGLCMFVLFRRGKTQPIRWVLVGMTSVLFLLCTAHVGVSLRQLLEAFIDGPADVNDYSTRYWINFTATPLVLKVNLYGTLLLTQDIILIWRLYVVFMHDWRVIMFPIILAVGCIGSIYAASDTPLHMYGVLPESVTLSLIISSWTLGFILNLSVTVAIAGRLWWMSRKMASLTNTSANLYASSIYVMIESGAISAVCASVILALFASHSPASLSSLDITSQLAGLMPLLIIVQVELVGQKRTMAYSLQTELTTRDRITFREGIPREEDSLYNLLPRTANPRLPGLVRGADTHI